MKKTKKDIIDEMDFAIQESDSYFLDGELLKAWELFKFRVFRK